MSALGGRLHSSARPLAPTVVDFNYQIRTEERSRKAVETFPTSRRMPIAGPETALGSTRTLQMVPEGHPAAKTRPGAFKRDFSTVVICKLLKKSVSGGKGRTAD